MTKKEFLETSPWYESEPIRIKQLAFEDGYKIGATEQKAIDIDNACKYLRDHIDPKLVIYHNETWCSLDEFIANFRRSLCHPLN